MASDSKADERSEAGAPVPWRVTAEGYLCAVSGGLVALRSPFRAGAFDGPEGCDTRSDHTDAELASNAARIVRAVNHEAALHTALAQIQDKLEDVPDGPGRHACRIARAALAASEEE